MNKNMKVKKTYFLILPMMYFSVWVASVLRFSDVNGLFVLFASVSFLIVPISIFFFYNLGKVLGGMGDTNNLYLITKKKVLLTSVIALPIFLIGSTLSDVYALIFNLLGVVLSLNVFPLSFRTDTKKYEGELYKQSGSLLITRFIDFFVGRLGISESTSTSVYPVGDLYNDVREAPVCSTVYPAYDIRGYSSGPSGFDETNSTRPDLY